MDITPPITLKFHDYPTIVLNYDKFNNNYKGHVTCTSYNKARNLVEADNESKVTIQVKIPKKHS